MPKPPPAAPPLEFDGFRVEPGRSLCGPDGRELDLPPRALDVLVRLLREPGRTVSRDELIEHAWRDTHVTDDALVQAVGALRRALGDDAREPTYIETMHGRGYRFIGPLPVASRPAPARAAATPPAGAAIAFRPLVLVTVSLAALGAIALVPRPPATPATSRIEFSLPVATDEIPVHAAGAVAIAPDGDRIVFTRRTDAGLHLASRRIDSEAIRPIPGTDGGLAPFFSPDGERIGFFVGDELRTVPAAGGTPRAMGTVTSAAGAHFGPDGILYVGSPQGIVEIREDMDGGLQKRFLTRVDPGADEQAHRWPHVLRDGSAVLFTAWTGSNDRSRIEAVDLASGRRRPLLSGAGAARADVPGQLTFVRGNGLIAADFSSLDLRVTGAHRSLATDVFAHPYHGAAHYGLSSTGTLAYVTGGATMAPSGRLEWASVDGPAAGPGLPGLGLVTTPVRSERPGDTAEREPPHPPGPVKAMRISPPGSHLAMVVEDGGGYRTWIVDLRSGERRLALGSASLSTGTTWSPDGRQIALAVARPDHDLVVVDVHSGAVAEELRMQGEQFPTDWIDGRGIVYESWRPDTGWDLWLLPADGGAPIPVAVTTADERLGTVSADGRLAYRHVGRSGAGSIRIRSAIDGNPRDELVVDIDAYPVWSASGELLARRGEAIVGLSFGATSATPHQLLPLLLRRGLVHFAAGADGLLLYVADRAPYREIRVVISA